MYPPRDDRPLASAPRNPVSPSHPRNGTHNITSVTRTLLFPARKRQPFWAQEIYLPARMPKRGPIWRWSLVVAAGAGTLLSPSAAPLFSGGLPRLETIKCCFSVHMWQLVGPCMKPLPTQSLTPAGCVPMTSLHRPPGQLNPRHNPSDFPPPFSARRSRANCRGARINAGDKNK